MKKKAPADKQSEQYCVRFTPAEAKKLVSLSKKNKCSIGSIIRDAVITFYL